MTKLIREGDRSEEVADVQTRLRSYGLDVVDEPGVFGSSTKKAVRAFQQQRAILVDGIVGPNTWTELVEASWLLGDRQLYLTYPPMRGDDVRALQARMNALGFDAGKGDGIFGNDTDRALRAFQQEYGVPGDGIFGVMSHAALVGLRVDRVGTAAGLREELRRLESTGLGEAFIVIDPGHGGQDTGTVAYGLVESDICWGISTRLADRLASYGARVRFTRVETEGPDASTRADRANRLDAELLVSIHLNANEEPTAEGCSTFFWSTSRAGEAAAEAVHSELVKLGLRDCRTHARSYTILRETRMPAILVEPFFITNRDEAKRIEDPDFLSHVAEVIAAGIRHYYEVVSPR